MCVQQLHSRALVTLLLGVAVLMNPYGKGDNGLAFGSPSKTSCSKQNLVNCR